MKKITLLTYSLIVAILLSLPACKGSSDEPKADYTAILSKSPWKIFAQTIDGTDVFSDLEDCEKDDIFRFKNNGEYTVEGGVLKCNVNEPVVFAQGNWSYDSNLKILSMNETQGNAFSGETEITELTSSSLVMECYVAINGTDRKMVIKLVPAP
ncbi:lipocalin family protein [Xanthocytophaga agilis]|uniref:Lipocalin family protein n=1 Tax=Xanthocytophaga agilis TaxID=3048010 RepID=A0AAE3UI42_9BACT|nr:lipocalin family protein [Xanthocytophaga agilis]MDJ1503238.1 lipocalin family protein [Xanthocytophaga agilis]